VALANRFGIKNSEWLTAMLEAMEADSGAMGRLLNDFIAETQGELFDSPAACIAFYSDPERYDQLTRGQIGDNLMYKYRALASFFLWDETCALACSATERLLRERGAEAEIEDFDHVWPEIWHYVNARHATGTELDALSKPMECLLAYDIPSWLTAGAPKDTQPTRFPAARRFIFTLSVENMRELEGALKVWSSRSIGLSKLITRIRYSAQVRDCYDSSIAPPVPLRAASA
jgi:hypothetical protein